MSLRAVFIDCGNTLLYEKPSRFEIYAQCARARGLPLSTAEMTAHMRGAHAELPCEIAGSWRYTDRWFSAYLTRIFHDRLGLSKAALPDVERELFGRFSDPETFALYPGCHELLEGLRAAGLRIGIVSNWSARLPGLLETLGIAERVDFVVCSAVERVEKPDPEIYRRALERAGVRPDEALHAGDDLEKDVLGPRRLGLRSVLVDHAGRHAGTGLAPRAQHLGELGEQIGGLL